MLQRKVDCPHCGNEISVNNKTWEYTKCCYCKRIVKVKFIGYGRKAKVETKAISFEEYQEMLSRGDTNEYE